MENTPMLKDWFERVDSEKTGTITAPQLKSALSVGNLEFSLSVVQQMIRMYDFDRNGTLGFDGNCFSNSLFSGGTSLFLKTIVMMKYWVLGELCEVQQAFSDRERGRGYIVLDDVYEALVKIVFSLDSPAFYTVCEEFIQFI
nr:sorcin [Quercus suber]